IYNSELVSNIFGNWPSFHDAEILSISLVREGKGHFQGPTLDALIQVSETTSDIDDKGHFVLRNRSVVTLRFFEIDDLRLDGFNHQNVISLLEIGATLENEKEPSPLNVRFHASFGVGAGFRCKAISVVEAKVLDVDSRKA